MSGLRRVLFTESSMNIGGQELQLLDQATGLSAAGIDTLLVCRPHSRIADIAAKRGIATAYLTFRNSFHPPSLIQLYRLLVRYRPNAIIAHSGHDANTAALAARLLRHRPLLVRSRTYQPDRPHAWTYNVLFDLTLVPSRYMQGLLLRNPRIESKRIRVLYPGIDFDHANRADESLSDELAHLFKTNRRILLHAAMLRAEKGHNLILSILPKLIQYFPDLCYVIAGDGELSEQLRREVATRGLGEHVVFTGMLSNLPALMQRAELVVMPSTYEPLGMSQIEALGMQVPVVASRIGGIPETVEDGRTGLLAEPSDAADWLSKLSWALAHPGEMRAMAAAGHSVVRERFSMRGHLIRLQQHLLDGLAKLHPDRFIPPSTGGVNHDDPPTADPANP